MTLQPPENDADEENARWVLAAKLRDIRVPGYAVTFDPEEADLLGAFIEDALTESDALESTADLPDAMSD